VRPEWRQLERRQLVEALAVTLGAQLHVISSRNAASYQRPCDCTGARDRRSTPTRMRVCCCARLGPCAGRVDLLPTPPDERHHAAVNDIPARHPESHSLTAPAGPWPRRRRHRPAQAKSNHERSKRERP
jgi:hypothetical protein